MSNYPSEFSVRLRNFANFIDSESFTIRPGLNTFIGVNNAGKTALLFALASLSSSAKTMQLGHPQGSVGEFVKRYKRPDGDPVFEVEIPFGTAREDILKNICSLLSIPYIPNAGDVRDALRFVWVLANDEAGLANIQSLIWQQERVTEKELLRLVPDNSAPNSVKLAVSEYPYGLPENFRPTEFDVTILGSRTALRPFKFQQYPNQISSLWPSIFDSVVLLSTHRNPSPRGQHQYAISLDPVASNLAQVLATIQMSAPGLEDGRDLFDAIQKELRVLFPEIKRVRTEIVPGDRSGQPLEVEVKLDLVTGGTVPLSHSGTGVQQILALLTGAIVSRARSLFLLDEPHSYLHPAAERGLIKLLERLGEQRGHFFCVATHSPIFASHGRKQLYGVRATGGDGSKVKSLSAAAEILSTIGISNPDLFTYSRVVFVEGVSDEKVLNAVSELALDPDMNYRLKIQPMGGDGILKSHSRAEFIELLYKANSAEVPVPIRFVLDSGDWSNGQQSMLSSLRDGEGEQVVHFLKRPEIENYLLNAEAITFALENRLATRNMSHVKPSVVSIRQIIDGRPGAKGSDVLAAAFGEYECDYSKNKDVEYLLSYLAANSPKHLQVLVDELSHVLGGRDSQNVAIAQH